MQHIDITLDLETLSLSPTAAIVQIAAIPWRRNAENKGEIFIEEYALNQKIDVRSCIKDGFTLDEETINWWAKQDERVKESVFTGDCHALPDTLAELGRWVEYVKHECKADTVCVWTQGSDFDIAILRHACAFYGIPFPFERTYFRDARTYILEIGYMLHFRCTDYNLVPAKDIYREMPPMSSDSPQTHDAMFDVMQTTWNVYHIMSQLRKGLSLAEDEGFSPDYK